MIIKSYKKEIKGMSLFADYLCIKSVIYGIVCFVFFPEIPGRNWVSIGPDAGTVFTRFGF